MTDFDLTKLPKALSAEERDILVKWRGSVEQAVAVQRALALIDALTEAMAEAVARMTVAEARAADWRETADANLNRALGAESERDAALARAEAAENALSDRTV